MVTISVSKWLRLLLLSILFMRCGNGPSSIQSKSEFLIYSSLAQVESAIELKTNNMKYIHERWKAGLYEYTRKETDEFRKSKVIETELMIENFKKLNKSFAALYEEMVNRNGGRSASGKKISQMTVVAPDSLLFGNARNLLTSLNYEGLPIDFERVAHPMILWKAKIQDIQLGLASMINNSLEKDLEKWGNPKKSIPLYFLTRHASQTSVDSIDVVLQQHYVVNELPENYQDLQISVNPPEKKYVISNRAIELKFDYKIPSNRKIDTLRITTSLPLKDTLLTKEFKYLIKY